MIEALLVKESQKSNIDGSSHSPTCYNFIEGPHFFDFLESQRIVGEKSEKFQHIILENIPRLGGSVAQDT